MNQQAETINPIALLRFYADIGVDEVMLDAPCDWTLVPQHTNVVMPLQQSMQKQNTQPTPMTPVTTAPQVGSFEALADAKALAQKAETIEALRDTLNSFEGLTLNRTSPQMVFADGNPKAKIMLIGDAPGMEDERLGLPFSGAEGALLDKMLAAIGLDRTYIYISHVVNWRPPGGRPPTDAEMALSVPFARRHIALINPEIVIFVGGGSAKAMLETTQSITRIRGKWQDFEVDGCDKPLQAMAFLHPAYLLASPAAKAQAWTDLRAIRAKLAI